MFKKCLKYDLKAFSKIWLIAAAVVLFISVIGGLGLGGMIRATIETEVTGAMLPNSVTPWPQSMWIGARMLIGFISYMLLIFSLAIFSAGGAILRLVHYYVHFFTDQGYLTFTLPVKRSTQFWSKAVSTLIYHIATGLVLTVSVYNIFGGIAVCCLVAPAAVRMSFLSAFPSLMEVISWPMLPYLLVAIALWIVVLVVDLFASMMFEFLIVTFAATWFRRLKIVSVLVTYYIVNNVLLAPIIYIGIYVALFVGAFVGIGFVPLFSIPAIGWCGIYLLLLLLILGGITVGLAMANLSIWRLERKVNLA